MGASQRRKGHKFERDIANGLKPLFPNARRHLEYNKEEANGIDIDNTKQYKIQCKKCKKYRSVTTINEIQCDRELGDIPIVVTAGDGLEPMAILPWSDLKMLIAKCERKG